MGVLVLFSSLVGAQQTEQDDLKAVQRQLEKKKASISQQTRLANQIEKQLKDAELDIAKSVTSIRKTQENISDNRREKQALEDRKKQLEADQQQQEGALSQQLRSAYMMGNHDYVRLLFNQQDASRLSRVLTYYQYLNQARIEQLDALTKTVTDLTQTQQDIDTNINNLKQLRIKQETQQQTLNQQQARRQTTLAKLQASIQTEAAEVEQLQVSEQNLRDAIERAQRRAQQQARQQTQRKASAVTLAGLQPFKGKLLVPTQGRFLNLFGKRRRGQVRWKGVLFESREGTPVVAIHDGKVLYSDWLKGLGLVTVVDHGEGFMSLYGHNQALLKQAGDNVEAGESIALVGQTGGRSDPSLYFEIRHKGQAINPNQWLKR